MAAKKKVAGKASKKDPIPVELYRILACPMCKSDVKYNSGRTALVCAKCKRKYAIKKGIPVMMPTGQK
ncbi:MAG: hypothetical protein QS98_C0002G0006 [archaeon GW2011_AR3]|nr:MAG: hypothetical protein QS98_C0002G0006 [archaeon GW2011_AR3]MBS3110004.1 Trm112 family protein [Candidatus Woesearchaeota archaeon]